MNCCRSEKVPPLQSLAGVSPWFPSSSDYQQGQSWEGYRPPIAQQQSGAALFTAEAGEPDSWDKGSGKTPKSALWRKEYEGMVARGSRGHWAEEAEPSEAEPSEEKRGYSFSERI